MNNYALDVLRSQQSIGMPMNLKSTEFCLIR